MSAACCPNPAWCDHLKRAGSAYVDSDSAGTWHIWQGSSHATGTGGRTALVDALRRHSLTPRAWRSGWAGYDESRAWTNPRGETIVGHVQISRASCQTWELDWSHAPA